MTHDAFVQDKIIYDQEKKKCTTKFQASKTLWLNLINDNLYVSLSLPYRPEIFPMKNRLLQHLWLNKQIKKNRNVHKLRTQRLISIKHPINSIQFKMRNKGNNRIISHRLKRSIRRVSWQHTDNVIESVYDFRGLETIVPNAYTQKCKTKTCSITFSYVYILIRLLLSVAGAINK